jgi:ATP-dependent DNA ligase
MGARDDSPAMRLPVNPPVKPMLAKAIAEVPEGEYLYDPKWDGFRALAFRDGPAVYLQSRDTKPLLRYFPELEAPLLESLPERCVVDGEVVIATGGALDFDALLLRIHPASSRVEKLAADNPASFVAFDILALGDRDLMAAPLSERSAALREALARARPPVHLSPQTDDPALARDWFHRFEGAGLDGVMAKPLAGPYEPNKRTMLKVKHKRTADCVVAGFRWHKTAPGEEVGSLLLGLHDDSGVLHNAGVASSFSQKRRVELLAELAPWMEGALENHPWREWARAEEMAPSGQRMPGATSRWNRGKDLSWVALRPERVAEVAYDHMQGDRFRHTTRLVRWRDDKPPAECTYDQLEVSPPLELATIFGV